MESLNPITVKKYNVLQINSIKNKYPKIREDSKPATFALAYQGTYRTLMTNLGFSKEVAQAVENSHKELYAVLRKWVHDELEAACDTGYVELAFGLRLRTPLLKQSILGTSRTMYEAEQEARTAGNALSGQSYGLLNNRAAVAFMKRVHDSKFRLDIKPIALIHDAIYLIIRDDIECLEWVNKTLIEEMSWQELPELQHDEVKLTAELDLFHPTWNDPITLPNNASIELLHQTVEKGLNK